MANIVYGDDTSCGIKKRVLHASRRELPEYPDGTRVRNARYVLKNKFFGKFSGFMAKLFRINRVTWVSRESRVRG